MSVLIRELEGMVRTEPDGLFRPKSQIEARPGNARAVPNKEIGGRYMSKTNTERGPIEPYRAMTGAFMPDDTDPGVTLNLRAENPFRPSMYRESKFNLVVDRVLLQSDVDAVSATEQPFLGAEGVMEPENQPWPANFHRG